MQMDFWLVIPVGPRLEYIDKVIKDSQLAANRIVIVKDRSTRIVENATNVDRPNILNIQIWWQTGIEYAAGQGARYVAVLSDDVKLLPGQLEIMHNELINSKVAMISSKISRKYGWGHAFIIDLNSGIRPDPRFRWYYGDYDLKYQAQRKGGFITSSQEIEHLEPGKLLLKSKELELIALQDRKKFKQKYPIKSSIVYIFNILIRFSDLAKCNFATQMTKLFQRNYGMK